MSECFGERARSLVGIRFRPQGRDCISGLDCVGVAVVTYRLQGAAIRSDYRLRGERLAELAAGIEAHFRRIPRTQAKVGDLLLLQVRPDQFHLAIKTADGFVHADARLKRVVETPGTPCWPIRRMYRRRVRRRA